MRLHLIAFSIVCVFGFGLLHPLRADDTESPESVKVWTQYHQVDQELTDTYQKILISLGSASQREKFTETENVWLKFRRVQGEFVAEGAPDKSAYKIRMANSFIESTQARISELKKWQSDQPSK